MLPLSKTGIKETEYMCNTLKMLQKGNKMYVLKTMKQSYSSGEGESE